MSVCVCVCIIFIKRQFSNVAQNDCKRDAVVTQINVLQRLDINELEVKLILINVIDASFLNNF